MTTSTPQGKKTSLFSSLRVWFFLGIAVLMGLVYVWSQSTQSGGQTDKGSLKKQPIPVVLATVSVKGMPVQIRTIGNVESVSSVTIRPQIDGQITNIFFKEGATVSKGQLLFTIDSQPIEASLAQAEAVVSKDQSLVAQAKATLTKDRAQIRQARATLEKDQAQLNYALAQEKRFASLLKEEFISQDQYEQAVATRRSAEATILADRSDIQNAQAVAKADLSSIESAKANVKADQALVESNRIKLNYTAIRAPIHGRTGSLKVHVGDTVKISDTPLIVIEQMNPIQVGFSVPEQNMKSVKMRAGERNLPVSITTREEPPTLLSGEINFLESVVDITTGTIRVKALFQNQNKLWPGQYVDVILNLANEPHAVVIPSQAVQSGQNGDYVFIAENQKVQIRQVVIDRLVDKLAVVKSGLSPGEQVVIDGQFQLSPGSPIQVKS